MKSRAYCFTLNNYTDDHIAALKELACQYLIFGKEVAPSTGTSHLQGYVYFENPRSFNSISRLFPWHIEVAKGTALQNKEYCSKAGDFFEKGKQPSVKSEGINWDQIYEDASNNNLLNIPRGILIRHYGNLKRMAIERPRPIMTNLSGEYPNNFWIWGPTGTGKSRFAIEIIGCTYEKLHNTEWNGYEGQEFVRIEEWSPFDSVLTQQLKIWTDIYPFAAKVNYGHLDGIRPSIICVTSNYSMDECFREPDLSALKRRFCVLHFTNTYKF